jgi:hypothetical protein
MAIDRPFPYFEKPKITTQRPMLTAGKATDVQDEFNSDYHLTIVEALKETGYSVKEVKALSSGEKVITVSDLLAASKQQSAYAFAYRGNHV